MIDFKSLEVAYARYDILREKVIVNSRVILKDAKKLIYAVHKMNASESKKCLASLDANLTKMHTLLAKNPELKNEGSFNEALEEALEAKIFYEFVFNESIPDFASLEHLGCSQDTYLCAIADFTGELVRRAVHLVIKEKYAEVEYISETIETIHKGFLNFNFRNGALRKKSDSIKYNRLKLEDMLYEIHMKKK
ncbi:MAG: hypothetical protein ACMXYK_02820 [Candidatus Woesearchaeota archaeon]